MNKRLLLALASVGIGGLAHAQSNVTLYGRINTDVETIRFGGATGAAFASQYRVSSNSSRFGLRGAEELGNSVQAIFQIESSLNNDSGTGTFAGRDTFAGLRGGLGRLRLGIMDTPFKGTGDLTDRFLGTGLQDDGNIAALGQGADGFGRRQINSIRYDTPILRGFGADVQWAWDKEEPGKRTVLSSALRYSAGPMKLAAAYEQHRQFSPGFVDFAFRTGGNFDIGPVNFGLAYTRLSYERPAGEAKRNSIATSVGVKLGAATINARYTVAGDVKGTGPTGLITTSSGNANAIAGGDGVQLYRGPNSGSYQVTLGAEYSVSRRTSLYTYYTQVKNEANANYRFGSNALNIAGSQGADPSAFALGLVHNF